MLQALGMEHCMMGPDTSSSHRLTMLKSQWYLDDPGRGGHPDLHQRVYVQKCVYACVCAY